MHLTGVVVEGGKTMKTMKEGGKNPITSIMIDNNEIDQEHEYILKCRQRI
jgi:hypothetical protein